MLELTQVAATAIAGECARRNLPPSSGIRIYPRRTKNDTSIAALVVEFVSSPEDDDVVIREGRAGVFLARGVDKIIGRRVLDVQNIASPPQFVLRAPRDDRSGALRTG